MMSFIKYTIVLLLLFGGLIFVVKSEENLQVVEQLFQEIEEDHEKLKEVFFKQLAPEKKSNCVCVPFYLCNIEEGKIITDGTGLLTSRVSPEEEEGQCEKKQDICCPPPRITLTPKMARDNQKRRCGYGIQAVDTSSQNNQRFSEYGEFPWTVLMADYQPDSSAQYKCVGSLIHPQVVLTAAHCIDYMQTPLAQAGEYNTVKSDEPKSPQYRFINQTIIHPKFKHSNLIYNVALLVTEEPFELDDHINTVCLANSLPSMQTSISNNCIASGWGKDRPNALYSDIMRKMQFSLVSAETCQTTFRETRLGKFFELHKTFLCGHNKYGSDTCEGNGGAPLACPIPNQPQRYEQAGIASWGITCAERDPSVFTNVPAIRDWIDEQFEKLDFSTDYYNYEDETNFNF